MGGPTDFRRKGQNGWIEEPSPIFLFLFLSVERRVLPSRLLPCGGAPPRGASLRGSSPHADQTLTLLLPTSPSPLLHHLRGPLPGLPLSTTSSSAGERSFSWRRASTPPPIRGNYGSGGRPREWEKPPGFPPPLPLKRRP